jgi:nicotinate-nucleotide adenylyltransferase
MAQAAFGALEGVEVVLDPHPFTVEAVRDGRFAHAVFVVGADEGADFPSWKEPEEVLRWVKLAVGTRSGYPQPELEQFGDRVSFFRFDSPPVSSTEARERVARGEAVDDLVPAAVADVIEELGLYR